VIFSLRGDSMSEKWENRIFIIGIILFILCLGAVVAADILASKESTNDRCQVYCECLETQDCPYTFDYDEVKGCECK
jgi:hypothetical protein